MSKIPPSSIDYDQNKISLANIIPIFFVAVVIIGLLIILISAAGARLVINQKVEYVDYNGETGYAKWCSVDDGSLYCRLEDGGYVSVKEFHTVGE